MGMKANQFMHNKGLILCYFLTERCIDAPVGRFDLKLRLLSLTAKFYNNAGRSGDFCRLRRFSRHR